MKTDVLIVGAGPVGLSCSLLLSQLGISNRVVERRSGLHTAPQAHVISGRTMEVFRAIGVDEGRLRAQATPLEDIGAVRWGLTLSSPEVGAFQLATPERLLKMFTAGPAPGANISQNNLEPVLFDEVRARGTAVDFCCEWMGMERRDGAVVSKVRNSSIGTEETIESKFLLGCDGASSAVRKTLGIQTVGDRRVQAFFNAQLRANFRDLVGHRPGILYWNFDPAAGGTFIAHDIDSSWVYMHPYDAEQGKPDDETCRAIVGRAIGTAHNFEILSIDQWMMTAEVAETYGRDNVFLIGDAAHRFPPTGGMGLNTGVADAFNLVWKLAAVMGGRADASLLDTYETERRPVAVDICSVSRSNFLRMDDVRQALQIPGGADADAIRAHVTAIAADAAKRARVQAVIDQQTEHFDMTGLDVGQTYEDGALIPDGTPKVVRANSVTDYVASGRPGARLPHAWIEMEGVRCSTLDLADRSAMVLFCGPHAATWAAAAGQIGLPVVQTGSAKIQSVDLETWLQQCGIETSGALLVRPDQHVAWRSAGAIDDAESALRAALDTLMRQSTFGESKSSHPQSSPRSD